MSRSPLESVLAINIDNVVVYIQRYRNGYGYEAHFVPPLTGIHLATLIPAKHTVRVIHSRERITISRFVSPLDQVH